MSEIKIRGKRQWVVDRSGFGLLSEELVMFRDQSLRVKSHGCIMLM